MDISRLVDKMMVKIITADFLESVERWARYSGERFDIGDADVHVENMGEFKRTTKLPKTNFVDGKITFSEELEDYHTYYDVTKISNSARCTDYNQIIIIAKKYYDGIDNLEMQNRPAELFIYAIFNEGDEYGKKADDKEYTKFPSFERLKKDFESKRYTHYHSLIYNFCGEYRLATYNDNSDRIFNITAISSDLDWLNEERKDIVKSIKVPKRLGNMTDSDRMDKIDSKKKKN